MQGKSIVIASLAPSNFGDHFLITLKVFFMFVVHFQIELSK